MTTVDEFVDFLVKKSPSSVSRGLLANLPGCNKVVWAGGAAEGGGGGTDGDGDEVPAKRGIPRESAGPIQEQAI